jgi:hypothetical protein
MKYGYLILAICWDNFPKQHQPACHYKDNRFCCVWDRTEVLCLIFMYFMYQQLNNGDVCVAQGLKNTHAQVWYNKLLSCFVTSRWLPSYFERLAPLYQLLWLLKVYNEIMYPVKRSERVSVTVTLFEKVESPDLGARSSGIAPCF